MKQSIFKFFFAAVVAMASVGNAFAQECPPNDEIWYTSTDGKVVTPYKTDIFGATIVSNTYSAGKGVIKFSGNVTSIGERAFEGCYSHASITNLATTPQTITSECFSNNSATLHVNKGLKSVYQAADYWKNFNILDDIPTIKATSIKLSASTYHCNVFGNLAPVAIVDPAATVKDVIWTSSDPSVLTILDEKTGQAFGMQQGTATITATTTDGSKLSASATVYVGD